MSGSSTATATRGDLAAVARDAWDTRPARRGEDSRVAGVGGAIARRYALDPTLVRVALVVWAIVGGGLLLYLVGWLVLPPDPADPPRRDRTHHGVRGRRPGVPPVVVIATIVVAFATFGPVANGRVTTVVALLLALGTLWLLHTARAPLGIPGTPGLLGAGAPDDDPGEPVDWDPLGADPRGWAFPVDRSDRVPTTPDRPRSAFVPATLGLALVAAGGALAALLLGVPGVTGAWVPAAALAVVGLGLVVGACVPPRRTRRGLVVAAIPLTLVTLLAAHAVTSGGAPPWAAAAGATSQGVGDVAAAPALAAAVAPEYRTGLGDVDLDLTRLPAGPGTPPVRTAVESGAGDVTVRVPATADVTVSCSSGLGDVDCLGATDDVRDRVDLGPDGPGGPAITLDVRSGLGDLVVQRG